MPLPPHLCLGFLAAFPVDSGCIAPSQPADPMACRMTLPGGEGEEEDEGPGGLVSSLSSGLQAVEEGLEAVRRVAASEDGAYAVPLLAQVRTQPSTLTHSLTHSQGPRSQQASPTGRRDGHIDPHGNIRWLLTDRPARAGGR